MAFLAHQQSFLLRRGSRRGPCSRCAVRLRDGVSPSLRRKGSGRRRRFHQQLALRKRSHLLDCLGLRLLAQLWKCTLLDLGPSPDSLFLNEPSSPEVLLALVSWYSRPALMGDLQRQEGQRACRGYFQKRCRIWRTLHRLLLCQR